MKCPFCIDKNKETSVLDSRPSENATVIRRRRICIECKGRFTTHERIQFRELVVVKKDGDKVNFDRDKITKSVELALRKRPRTRPGHKLSLDDPSCWRTANPYDRE